MMLHNKIQTITVYCALAALVSLANLLSGCSGSRGTTGNSIEPTLSSIQTNIFNKSCATSGCHDAGTKRGGLALDPVSAYGGLINAEPHNPSAKAAGMQRVVPGDPDKSYLLSKLVAPGSGQGKLMPIGASPLSDEEIEAIRTWIANGASEK